MTDDVVVAASDLTDALRTLEKIARSAKLGRAVEAIVLAQGGELRIELPGMAIGVPASGALPGRLRVSWIWLRDLGKGAAKRSEEVPFAFQDGFLSVGRVRTSAILEDQVGHPFPLNAELPDLLAFAIANSADDIRVSGLGPAIAAAQTRGDQLVAKAAAILKPLGIEKSELAEFVGVRLRSRKTP